MNSSANEPGAASEPKKESIWLEIRRDGTRRVNVLDSRFSPTYADLFIKLNSQETGSAGNNL